MSSSSKDTVNLMQLLSTSVAAANHAGFLVRSIMKKGDLGIVDKGVNDLQTEADRSAQRLIVKSITERFPEVTVIGEEGILDDVSSEDIPEISVKELNVQCPEAYTSVASSDIVVWVDPLDGTTEYAEGLLDHVTVLIGIAVSGKAVAGVIHQPYYGYKTKADTTGRTVWSCLGAGVHGIESFKEADPNKFVITTTRSHMSKEIKAILDSMKPDEVVSVGGAGNKVLLVIEGLADAYVYPSSGCKKWDTCAPEAVLREKGGILTDIHGQALRYDKHVQHLNAMGVLATKDPKTQERCLSLIPQHVKDKLSGKSGL